MPDRVVPREEWIDFCRSFTLQHRGWRVTLEEVAGGNARVLARDEPFHAISAEGGDGTERILISLGEGLPGRVLQTVPEPTTIHVEETSRGAHSGLTIDSPAGPHTRLRFRSEMRPEEVDGYLPPR